MNIVFTLAVACKDCRSQVNQKIDEMPFLQIDKRKLWSIFSSATNKPANANTIQRIKTYGRA
jgi:hypothetical protein